MGWNWALMAGGGLIGAGAVYIAARWRRPPQAYAAMLRLAVCYFDAGALLAAQETGIPRET